MAYSKAGKTKRGLNKIFAIAAWPRQKLFVTINHNLLDWKRLCAQIDHVPAAKVGKACCCWKRSESWGVCRTPPTLPTSLQALRDPPENHLSSVISTFAVVFVLIYFILRSPPYQFENFVGVGYHPSMALWGFARLEPKLGETAFVCGLPNFE